MDMSAPVIQTIRHFHPKIAPGFFAAIGLAICSIGAHGTEVKDLKYGAVLFEFYQQKYFEALVEFAYAQERGGIQNHGTYPELLKGGVSLSYGLDQQAQSIFSQLIAKNASQAIQNRAWFYLAKMLYLRGEIESSVATLANIQGDIPRDIDQEYRYLGALANIKLGNFDQAQRISSSFDKNSPYAPFLYFNLGVALGKQHSYAPAIASLEKAASYRNRNEELDRLADRANMAIAYLYDEEGDGPSSYRQTKLVHTTGIFSNRALLGSAWASVNNDLLREALAPLTVLQERSMAVPEVQEAVLLLPYVYEKLGLIGRAADGFIKAYDRYTDSLEQIDSAKETLRDADVLELFVRNMDDVLDESDWFGAAPSVSLNSLSPFLLDLMSDHSFQSVLKDLRDLYAIRNNLEAWKRKRNDFKVILDARSASFGAKAIRPDVLSYVKLNAGHQDKHDALELRASSLDSEGKKRVKWLLDDIQFGIDVADAKLHQFPNSPGISPDTTGYGRLVEQNMRYLEAELERTNALIAKVEAVLLELVNAELEVHEERIKYYRIQAHLAKARILDRSLANLDNETAKPQSPTRNDLKSSAAQPKDEKDYQGVRDAP
jgi:tetratricopeptide (TPR) repeat protein